ncbi:hypothetical protein PHMEG_00010541 [Phytophthora megakarya]|uniref:Uncharacterized protein n=1 Tax=Phytophthora megakarya TaxID=4795 RepID=A0A225WDG4_9STRA|nr:hypothetical protein PHMEG_00010541 [Phytophthora megakarya]
MLVPADEEIPLDQEEQHHEAEELAEIENNEPGPLCLEQVAKRLSVLGRNPFTQAHIYTTATLTNLHLLDIDAIRAFPHIQHLICSQNELQTLSPLQYIPLLLTLDASNNNLTEVLDFVVPKCCPGNAWADGARWIGSLLRKANLDKNQIAQMPRHELALTHPFLLELRLAHNEIAEISGVSQLHFLRVLDLSHNRLTSMQGLVNSEDSPRGLQALETLLLSHNQLTTIDSNVALLSRLTQLGVAHNQLRTLSNLGVRANLQFFVLTSNCFCCHQNCVRLQRLELAHNNVADINELNCLAGLRYLGHISLHGLLQLDKLDDEQVTSKEKVKALVLHGNDFEARRQVAAKYLSGQEFTDFLPPMDFEDDKQLELPPPHMSVLDELANVEEDTQTSNND